MAADTSRDAEIDAWVMRELAKPEAQKPLTSEQERVITTVLANHLATQRSRTPGVPSQPS